MSTRTLVAAGIILFGTLLDVATAQATGVVVGYARPGALSPGAQQNFSIFGAGFSGDAGPPSVTVGGMGVVVDNVRVESASRLRATITVAADAALGLRDVTVVQTDGTQRTARAALAIVDARPPRIRGIVRGPAGEKVCNARITIFDGDLALFREARTSASGRWAMAGLPLGTYVLGVAADGYDYVEDEVEMGRSSHRNFQLGKESHPGSWSVVGNTAPEFFDATDIAILTADARLFYCHDTQEPVVFDPTSGQKTFPDPSPSEQGCTAATLLADDRIIFIGGQSPSDPGSFGNAVPWVKTYGPTGWNLLPNLQLAAGRWYPGLARLSDGSLLVMGGGMAPDATRTATAELFDLASETWSNTGSMLAPAEYPPAALLFTGEVLITWAFPQLYNPTSGAWRATGGFVQGSRGYPDHSDHSLVVMADGRAIAVGIRRGSTAPVMSEIYDSSTASWSLTANSGLPRKRPEVVQLPDGKILAAAGEVEGTSPVPDVLGMVKWTDLYDPDADNWRRVADMLEFREYHAITLLVPDGRVLSTGGTRIKFQTGPTAQDIEAYSPPYLFRGVRPQISNLSASSAPRGTDVSVSVFPDTEITSAVLIGTGATTHWVDGGIPRRLVLNVTQTGSAVSVTMPTDPNLLPLGHYILFLMVDGIPSNGVIVRVEAS